MTSKINQKQGAAVMKNKILFITLLTFASLLLAALDLQAQTPEASPTPSGSSEKVTVGGYEVTSSIELGVRGLHVNGNHDKYRSDFNYKPGFRVFDTSLLLEDHDKNEKFFDSLLFTSTGWNADPTGSVRVNVEKTGLYRFDSSVRRVQYYNQLFNHAFGWKGANTKRNFGDFDLTIRPADENFRMRFGGSFYRTKGTGGFTTRVFSDEFPITRNFDLNSNDIRAGVDGKLAGFKLSLTVGDRRFEDETNYTLLTPQIGYGGTLGPPDPNVLTALQRNDPIRGNTKYATFAAQRTFAERLDVTGRFIYSVTDRNFNQFDLFSGRGAASRTNPALVIFDRDLVQSLGDAKRTQSRGDFGVTYAVTDKFRISNTFVFEQYNVSGDSNVRETVESRLAATGVPRPTTATDNLFYRFNGFKRYINTIEGDYQFNPRFGINIGYRYTHRIADIAGFNRPQVPAGAVTVIDEEEENSTNTLLIGTSVKPFKNWSIFADIEHGQADNAFTRLSNYNFTNVRVRSNWNYKQFTFNVSGIVRNNENPSQTSALGLVPAGELISNVKNRVFSAYVDWSPDQRFSLSTGYTYHHLTSETDIVVPLATFTPGFSQFFMRDSYAFVDVSAQPINRVSVYASYRFNKDRGQGDRQSNQSNIIISSYPFRLNMPEIRVAVRLTRNIDWNVGYQYYDYKERLERGYFDPFPPNQNYNAHMPYTSLRFYFGGRGDNR